MVMDKDRAVGDDFATATLRRTATRMAHSSASALQPSYLRMALDRLYLVTAWAGAACVLAVFGLMLAQALLRLNGTMVRGADDLTAWACAGAAFLPLAATFKRGELVRMGIVIDQFSDTTARWIELTTLTLCSIFAVYMTYWLGFMAYESYIYDSRGQGLLALPLWIPQFPVAFGSGVLAIALIDEWVRVAYGFVPTYIAEIRARHAAGDYSGEV
jgi:TRAP-type C4-dicarboxylate transport system permease small subunit